MASSHRTGTLAGDLQVFGSEGIDKIKRIPGIPGNDKAAVGAQSRTGVAPAFPGQGLEMAGDGIGHGFGELVVPGDQKHGGIIAVFGLDEKIEGHAGDIRGVIGEHHGLRGSGRRSGLNVIRTQRHGRTDPR